jgi:hypothetical protein
MQALPGGKATNAKIAAPKMAAWLRGGRLPQASVSPAALRSTRDLMRRRTPLLHHRAELSAPVQQTNAPDTLPDLGKKIADKANREGVAERLHDPAVPKTSEGALALMTDDEEWRRAWELARVKTATQSEAPTLYGRQTGPGLGPILRLVLRDDIHVLGRLPRVQACAAYARLVQCRKAAAGTRLRTSGQQIGHAPRKWAFAEAATVFLRNKPNGPKLLTR